MAPIGHDAKTGKYPRQVPREKYFVNMSCQYFMTQKKRNFMMGNALVVGVIEKIGEEIEKIIDNEK